MFSHYKTWAFWLEDYTVQFDDAVQVVIKTFILALRFGYTPSSEA